MRGKLEGKIALITGGSSGIGLATAQLFVQEGAEVIITGRRQTELDKAKQIIGGNVHLVCADVTKLADIKNLRNYIQQSYGRLDVLFANAGALHIGRLVDITEADYNRVMDTSIKGTLFTIQQLDPLLTNSASIVVNAAAIASKGIRGLALNAAAKSAVRSLARTFATEFADRNIRVNAISPGSITTPILEAAKLTPTEAMSITDGGAPIPLHRPGDPEEVAKAVLFLSSEESSYVTGIDLPVDGGQAQV